MRTKISIVTVGLAVGMAVSFSTQALDLRDLDYSIEPRFETGVLIYDFDQEGIVDPGGASLDGGVPLDTLAVSKFSISDTLPFFGGGFTFFAERLFVDLSVQYAFNGKSQAGQDAVGFQELDSSGFRPGFELGVPFVQSSSVDTEFSRIEGAVSVGYAFTKNAAIFAGYKRVNTAYDRSAAGFFRIDDCGFAEPGCVINPAFSSTFTLKNELEFDYDGPFFGFNILSDKLSLGVLEGNLSGNIALAFLNGELKTTSTSVEDISLSGFTSRFDLPSTAFKGDMIGLSAGITWKGITPIDNLNYILGANGYNYTFNSTAAGTGDVSEAAIYIKFGIVYAFDL